MAKKQIATFLAPNKGLTVATTSEGVFCYAYSGVIPVANTEITMLDFVSPPGIIECSVTFNYPINVSDDYLYQIYFNNQVVQAFVVGSGHTDFESFPIPLIIPSNTRVQMTADNIADTSSNNQVVSLAGRLYA